jgi:hypothetical protein
MSINKFFILCILSFLLNSCENYDFQVKGRFNPEDSLFQRSVVKVLKNGSLNYVSLDSEVVINWKVSVSKADLINPVIQILKNHKVIYQGSKFLPSQSKGSVLINPANYGFEHLDELQVYFVQKSKNKEWIDSMDKGIHFYDKERAPVFSELSLKDVQPKSMKLNFEVVISGSRELSNLAVCMNKTGFPTVNDIVAICDHKINDGKYFEVDFNSLTANTMYFLRIFSKNNVSEQYTKEQFFTTLKPDKPVLGNTQISNVTSSSVTLSSNILNNGGGEILESGFCFDKNDNPDIFKNVVKSSNPNNLQLTLSLANLDRNTQYFVRSFARNQAGISYGATVNFKTNDFKVFYTHSCDQLTALGFNNFTSKCKYWTGVQYAYVDWEVNSNGYSGNCLMANTPKSFPIGGYIHFTYNSPTTSKVTIWVLASQAGYQNRLPQVHVDGKYYGNASIIEGSINSATWMRLETPEIPSGNHNLKFEWSDVGTSYTYKIDEIIIYN